MNSYYPHIERSIPLIAIYVRVSTEEQSVKGYSVRGQIEECMQKAGTTDVLKYVDDGFSGELLARPELDRLREDINEGLISKLVCYDPDRLSRKLLNQLLIDDEIRKNNVELLFVNGEYANSPEGQLFFSMRGAISEFEKAKIKERTSSGRRRKAKEGYVVKNSGLFGYDYDTKNKTYVINADEAKIIQMIFHYFTDPDTMFKGINGIAKHLTDLGIPTARGGKTWHRQVVRQILLNESYTGVYYQNKYDTEGDYVNKQAGEAYEPGKLRPREEWIEARIPQIIANKQYDFAQVLLKQSRRRYSKLDRHAYLLSGLVRCGRCGETMTGRKRKSHGKDFFVYECRKNYAGAKSTGCGRTMSENKLNDHVWAKILRYINNPTEIASHESEPIKSYVEDEIKHLKEQIENAKKGRSRLLTLVSMSEEDLDIEEIKDKMRELQQKEKELRKHLEKLQSENEEVSTFDHTSILLEKALEYYMTLDGENLSIEDKQKILCMIVEEIEVINSEVISIHTF